MRSDILSCTIYTTFNLTGNLQDYETETHLLGRLFFRWCRRQRALVGAGGRAAGRRYVLQLRCRVAAVVVTLLLSHGRRRQRPGSPGNNKRCQLSCLLKYYLKLQSKD